MKILSKIKEYEVIFDSSFSRIREEYSPGDVFILDSILYEKVKEFIPPSSKVIKIETNEKAKSLESIFPVIEEILKDFNKSNKIICIGGGITQDISGFISSILFRGVDWIFFPTTLLAQGDSCIGSKTSINFKGFKNQLGTYYPPSKVILNVDFLKTLSDSEIKSGLGEMLHYFLISGKEDFEFFLENKENLPKLIKRALEIKKVFIEKDEFDKGERLILNFGHTFGHALEGSIGNKASHGIAVCFGMLVANTLSESKEYLPPGSLDKVNDFLRNFIEVESIDYPSFVNALKRDKKNVDDSLTCILTKGLGKMFVTKINYSEVPSAIHSLGIEM